MLNHCRLGKLKINDNNSQNKNFEKHLSDFIEFIEPHTYEMICLKRHSDKTFLLKIIEELELTTWNKNNITDRHKIMDKFN